MDFQVRILNKSGLSEETFFPPGLHKDPPEFDMKWAREEAELVMFNAVKDLLAKTRLAPRDIDVLVVNCSLFNPTPSLSAMIINHFGMRSNIDSFNLGGMGCSAGIIAVDLAAKMLRERGHGGYALVVSTENITQNWYHGNERSMLIPNTIFRMGSAAILLTSHAGERPRSKYELQHVVRCHLGANDEAYKCVFQRPDDRQFIGVELDKNLVSVASKAMETNMTRLGPLVLPWSEKLVFAANWVARNVLRMRVARYIPDFREAFDHFCLHAGGRGVVEGLSKQLRLTQKQMAPSANTLHWYGNTSSSTVWYSFGFVESVQGVKRGDIVWQPNCTQPADPPAAPALGSASPPLHPVDP
ncbi:3-ketoacyl-synthase 20-like [Micractinium conductrix]|uniref:3-ketoacyl-synthase 20-like n=1 Tax=Micractinium conductrix TaxID=554055 RepID=A0A2P6VLW6_9CHLO|nr:3-ketoacyl-synthase 20-like [Micractinium conductrix]|eukprot:PSC75078.1 3-ketoacyl-synthase 20-like [Micractinium conductrix]